MHISTSYQRVRVLTGTGTGCLKIPLGYPCQSLVTAAASPPRRGVMEEMMAQDKGGSKTHLHLEPKPHLQ